MDSSGNLLGGAGTPYCFRFSLYDDATVGAPDVKLWPAGTPLSMTVTVKNGVYNVGIGDVAAGGDPLTFDFQSNDTVFLNIEVATKTGAVCGGFENLSPREPVYAAGYAINSDTVDGFHAAQSATGNQIPALTANNLVLGAGGVSVAANQSYTGAGAVTVSSGAGTALSLLAGGAGDTGAVQIGAGGGGSSTPDLLALDVKSDAGDPIGGVNGEMYYNANANVFRCFVAGFWSNCDTTGGTITLQSAYTNGNTLITSGAVPFAVNLASGNFNVNGTGAVNLTPTAASQFTSGGALTLTGGAASTWSTTSGNLTLQAGSGIITTPSHVGIGTTTPTAEVQLAAGTSAAGTAPLKLTAGTNLTTPEAGALEYDGTNLYFTPAGTRQTLLTAVGNGQNLTLARIGSSTYSTLQDLQNIFHSAGWVSGGVITNAGGGTVNISSGSGLIRNANTAVSQVAYFDWAADNGVTIPANSVRYIGVEYNAGSPQVAVRTVNNWNLKTDFPIGEVVNEAGTLTISSDLQGVGDHAANMIQREYETMPLTRDARDGGLVISGTGTRKIAVSSGALWDRLDRYAISAIDTNVSGGFDAYYRDGGSSFVKVSGLTQWSNTQYDNNTGTLATIAPGDYGVQWFYLNTNGQLMMVYGRGQYTSPSLADAETEPDTLPDRIMVSGALIGKVVYQQGNDTPKAVSSAYTTSFPKTLAASISNLSDLDYAHSGLTGFADSIAGVNDNVTSMISVDSITPPTGLNITADGASTWSTSAGNLTVDSAAALNLGTTTATAVNIGSAGVTTVDNGNLQVTGNFSTPKGADYSASGSHDNVNLGTGSMFRYTGVAPATFTGLAGGTDGRILTILNAEGASGLTISNDSGSSLADNRIITGTGADIMLPQDTAVLLQYEVYPSGEKHWHVIAPPSNILGSLNAFIQGGNSFGTAGTLGTSDFFGLNLVTGGATALALDTSGNGTLTGGLTVNGGSVATPAATALNVTTGTTGALTLDSGTTGAVNLGTSSNPKIVTIGNTTGVTAVNVHAGSGGISLTGNTSVTGANTLSVGTGAFSASGNFDTPRGGNYSAVGTQNNVNLGAGSLFYFTGSSPVTISGIAGGTDGRQIKITNISSSTIHLTNLDGGSSGANQIATANGQTATLNPNGTVNLQYDAISSLWRVTALPVEEAALDQGGNAFGATVIAGTTDANALHLITDGVTALALDTSGNANLTGNLTVTGGSVVSPAAAPLNVTSGTTGILTLDSGSTGGVNVGTGGFAKTVTVGNTTGATTLDLQSGSGNINLQVAGTGTTGDVQIGSGSGTATPDFLVLDVKNNDGTDPAGGVNGASYYNSVLNKFRCFEGGGWKDCDTTGGTTTLQTAYNAGQTITTSSSHDIALTLTSGNFTASGAGSVNLTPSGASSFVSGDALTLTAGAASTWGTTAGNLDIQVAGTGATGLLQVGNGGAGSATPDLLVLDTKNDNASDPAPTNGAMYYNSSTNKFRCVENGLWKDCDTSGGLGLTSLNGQSGASQTFATGTSGTDFNISSGSNVHTFNIPDASTTNRGLVTTGTQTFGGSKTFNNDLLVNGNTTLGDAGGDSVTVNAATVTLAGNSTAIDMTGSGTLSLNTATNRPVTVGSGLFTANGAATVTGTFTNPGNYVTPKGSDYSTPTGSQNNVDLGTGSLIRFTGGSQTTFTGLAGGTDGRFIRIMNASSSNLLFTNESGSSTDINRVLTPSGGTLTIDPGVSVGLQYDAGVSRWRVVVLPASSGTVDSFAYVQGGNSFGATATLGTNDANPLNLITDGGNALTLDTSGNGVLTGGLTVDGGSIATPAATGLNVTTGTTGILTLDSGTTGAVNLGTGGSTKTVTVGNTSGGTAVDINSGSGNVTVTGSTTTFQTSTATNDALALVPHSGGGASFTGTITSADLTGSGKTWTFPNLTGNILLDTSTCPISGSFACNGGNSLGAALTVGTTDSNVLNLFTGGATRFTVASSASTLTGNGATTVTSSGGALTVDSAAALNLGTSTATSVSLGKSGITTTNNGALTVSQLLTGNLGATISGGTVNLNASSNNATNIGTGSTNAAVTIGGGANTVAVNSSNWGVSTAGAISGLTGYTQASGAFAATLTGTNAATFSSTTANTDSIAIKPQTTTATAPFTGTITSADLTAGRTWTFPNLSGNVLLDTSTCSATGSFACSGGNTLGAAFSVGTTDSEALNLITGGATRFAVASGAATLTGTGATTVTSSGGALTVDSAAALNLGTSTATSVSLGATGVTTTNNGALTVTQATTLNGGLAVNTSGSITTDQTTFNLVNATATTVNFAGAATAVNIGAATGTMTVSNPTFTLTNGTTLNMNGASPSIVTTSAGTASVFDTNASTVNIGGGSTTLNLAGGSGSTGCTIDSSGNFTCTGTATFNGAGTTTIGGAMSVGGNVTPSTDNTYTLGTASLRWKKLHVGPGSVDLSSTTGTSGAGTNYTLGSLSFSGTNLSLATSAQGSGAVGTLQLTTGGNVGLNVDTTGKVGVGTASPSQLFAVGSGSPFTVDTSGNEVTSGTIADNGGTLSTTTTSFTLVNANATTVSFAGAASTLGIGAATGTATINNATINLQNGVLQTGGTQRLSNAGALSNITGYTQSSGAFAATLTTTNAATFSSSTTNADSIAIKPQTTTATASFTGTLTSADLTAGHTWTFPNADGTVAVSASAPLGLDAAGNLTCTTCVTAQPRWDQIQNPTGNLSLTMGANTTLLTYNGTTGSGVNMFRLVDTASNTGTGYIFSAETAASSSALPFRVVARGNTIIDTTATGGVTIGNATSAQPVTIDAGTASLNFGNSNSAKVISIGTGTAVDTIHIGDGGTGADIVTIGSNVAGQTLALDAGTAATAIQIGNSATAHGIEIGSNATGANAILLGGANSASTLTLEGGTAATAIQIGNGGTAHGIQIGTGSAIQTLSIGSTNSSSQTSINAGSNGLSLNATSGNVTLQTTTSGTIILQPLGTGTTGIVNIGAGGGGSATPDMLALDVKSTSGDPSTTQNGYMYYSANTNTFRCYGNGAWGDCSAVRLDQIKAATATNTIANANFAQTWNWGTLTTQTGLTLGGGTAMTTGSVFAEGGATYVHTAAETGSMDSLTFTDASTNTSGASTTNGLSVASTLNTSGAGTKSVNALNVAAATLTGCASGACTWSGLTVNTQATGAAATITQNGLNIAAAGIGAGTLNGINIGNITAGAGTETALNIGSGWDKDLVFNDPNTVITIPDASVATPSSFSINDSAGNNLFMLRDMGAGNAAFGAEAIAGSFINRNSVYAMEFQNLNPSSCAGSNIMSRGEGHPFASCTANSGSLSTGATTSGAGSSCTWTSVLNAVNGIESNTAVSGAANGRTAGCNEYLGTTTVDTADQVFNAANKPVVVMKVKPSAVSATQRVFVGIADSAAGYQVMPQNGIFFTNCTNATCTTTSTNWQAVMTIGGVATVTDCGVAISTSQFAFLRAEVRKDGTAGNSDVHFYVDGNVSDGITETECGTGITTATPVGNLSITLDSSASSTSASAVTEVLYTDYIRVYQDDAPLAPGALATTPPAPVVIDYAATSALGSSYPSAQPIDSFKPGMLVSLDRSHPEGPFVMTTTKADDSDLVGVVTAGTGLILDNDNVGGPTIAVGGRTKVLIDSENGPVSISDYLTSSSTAGVAMKANKGAPVFGRVLSVGMDKDGNPEVIADVFTVNNNNSGDVTSRAADATKTQAQINQDILASLTVPADGTDTSELDVDRVVAGLSVISNKGIFNDLQVDTIGSLSDAITLASDTVFVGRPYFNSDMGGFAVVGPGDDHVDVVFDQPYETEPIINASLNFDGDGIVNWQNIRYAITNKSVKGFTIQLYQTNGGQDVKFSWMALAIKNARTAHSNGSSASTSTTSADAAGTSSPSAATTTSTSTGTTGGGTSGASASTGTSTGTGTTTAGDSGSASGSATTSSGSSGTSSSSASTTGTSDTAAGTTAGDSTASSGTSSSTTTSDPTTTSDATASAASGTSSDTSASSGSGTVSGATTSSATTTSDSSSGTSSDLTTAPTSGTPYDTASDGSATSSAPASDTLTAPSSGTGTTVGDTSSSAPTSSGTTTP